MTPAFMRSEPLGLRVITIPRLRPSQASVDITEMSLLIINFSTIWQRYQEPGNIKTA